MKVIELVDRHRSLAILSIKIVTILSEGYNLTITLEGDKKILIRGSEEEIRKLKTIVLNAWETALGSNSISACLEISLKDYNCKIADCRI